MILVKIEEDIRYLGDTIWLSFNKKKKSKQSAKLKAPFKWSINQCLFPIKIFYGVKEADTSFTHKFAISIIFLVLQRACFLISIFRDIQYEKFWNIVPV